MKKIKPLLIQGFQVDSKNKYVLPITKGNELEVSTIKDDECFVKFRLGHEWILLNDQEILDLWSFLNKVIAKEEIS